MSVTAQRHFDAATPWWSPTQAQVAAALSRARNRDALGHQIHTALAVLFLFALPLATAPKEYPFAALIVWTAIRLPHTWRSYGRVVRNPALLALLAWSIWHLTSFAWSSAPEQGFDEFGAQRVLLLPLLVWPILDRVPWLVAAALTGVAAQNGAQVLQALDWLNLRPHEGEGRYGGLMHPIKTGAWCAAAMCWHLAAILSGRGWVRWVSLLGFAMAAGGLIATESRGPWLAAAVSVPSMLLIAPMRRPAVKRAAIAMATAGLVTAGAFWPVFGGEIANRVSAASKEAVRAHERGVYWTSVGLRVGMTRWAWDAFTAHPVLGVGAGGYPDAQAANPDYQAGLTRAEEDHKRRYMTKAHPHSWYLYALACTGAVGGLLVLCIIVLSIRQAWLDPPTHVYADGTLFALLAWFIGAQFDCYNLDGQRLGLLALMLAATLSFRPPVRHALAAAGGEVSGDVPQESNV